MKKGEQEANAKTSVIFLLLSCRKLLRMLRESSREEWPNGKLRRWVMCVTSAVINCFVEGHHTLCVTQCCKTRWSSCEYFSFLRFLRSVLSTDHREAAMNAKAAVDVNK